MSTPIMPDAPENRMMQGGAQPQPMPPAMGVAPNAMQGPEAAPQGPPQAPPTPEEVAGARKHIATIMDGLIELTSKPKGQLSKADVFKAASGMIADGAFKTPQEKQDLIVRLAGLPQDESGLRKALGALLLSVSTTRAQLHHVFGEG